ncbi:hypothetical protein CSQ88_17475 [Iodobacter sp. BJB302]|nr:hypothetical protein CSQ88_17475 [Iodobacter sp. BJB302]
MKTIEKGIYQHYKGPLYQVIDLAKHSETEEEMVVYRHLYGEFDLWVRPLAMFIEEITYNCETMPRFRWHSR